MTGLGGRPAASRGTACLLCLRSLFKDQTCNHEEENEDVWRANELLTQLRSVYTQQTTSP